MKDWVIRKYARKDSKSVQSYHFLQKNFECEVCKASLPYSISFDGQKIELIEIERPTYPYLILENISRQKK
jgi:hypothetical protein